jgi:aminobenzoyl-glutamate transport protein
MSQSTDSPKGSMQRFLDLVERVGNRVPHPIVIFLILIAIVFALSHVLYLLGASVSYQVVNPETHKIDTVTTSAKSLLTAEGIRAIYVRFIPNFMGFKAIGLLIVAMIGVGVAEEAGLVRALIRMLVLISPGWALTYILAFLGVVSTIAADAGYLVLVPLAGVAFHSLGRHPLAGLALGFASVACAFTVNMMVKPLDAVLVEITNDAIHMVDPSRSIAVTANLWFSMASAPLLTIVVALVTDRVIVPRLGKYEGDQPLEGSAGLSAEESRGLGRAALGFLGVLVFFGFLTLPQGAPLRSPETGALIGNSPFMNGLITAIMVLFVTAGVAYGTAVGTIRSVGDVIAAMTKAVSELGGTILLFVVISQFIEYFSYSHMATLIAVEMADALKAANIGPLWLLVGLIVVIAILTLVFTPAIPKWAVFAPVFVPLFVQLGVDPAAVLAAFRVGDAPTNPVTPLNPYFALMVGFAQRYRRDAGVGTVVALMLPYVAWVMVLWPPFFVAWYLLELPWGI